MRQCVPRARNLTRTACERLKNLESSVLPAVCLLPAPPDGTEADEHLATEMERFGRGFAHAKQKYGGSLTRLVDAGSITHSQFVDFAGELDAIEHRVSETTFASILQQCSQLPGAEALAGCLRGVRRSLSAIEAKLAHMTALFPGETTPSLR